MLKIAAALVYFALAGSACAETALSQLPGAPVKADMLPAPTAAEVYASGRTEQLKTGPAGTETLGKGHAPYTDNGNGTVTDKKTGLMWVKDGTSAGCNGGDVAQWPKAVAFCENLVFAGHSDWRLPDRKDLMSIVDRGQSGLSVNATYFPNTHGSSYWTSTKNYPDSDYAWSILFFYGGVPGYDMTDNYHYVRCVRAGR